MTDSIKEDADRLQIVDAEAGVFDPQLLERWLKQDCVVLLRRVKQEHIDDIVAGIADRFDLRSGLELQASFAAIKNHRKNISRYYMSVNARKDYQCILPHCEGRSFTNLQLVSFFCYENTTDGGQTVLFNIDEASQVWGSLREQVKRGRSTRRLTEGEIARARMKYHLHLPEDHLQEGDRVLREHETDIAGLTIVDALVMPRKTHSKILGKELFAFWSSMKSTESNLYRDFVTLMRGWNIYIEPPPEVQLPRGDTADSNRAGSQHDRKMLYEQLFKSKLVLKLVPGDLVVMNNQSWTHAANNWSPGSGVRRIGVAIA
jgi:hypothetical protein